MKRSESSLGKAILATSELWTEIQNEGLSCACLFYVIIGNTTPELLLVEVALLQSRAIISDIGSVGICCNGDLYSHAAFRLVQHTECINAELLHPYISTSLLRTTKKIDALEQANPMFSIRKGKAWHGKVYCFGGPGLSARYERGLCSIKILVN